MEQYENKGYRESFFQWALGQKTPAFFVMDYNKIPILRILYSVMKYVGEFGLEDYHDGGYYHLSGDVKIGSIRLRK